jgi:hypothetical protein
MHTKRNLCFALGLLSLAQVAEGKKKSPRFVIQVGAQGSDKTGMIQSLYLILPDGSHATATCVITTGKCGLESFAPEKRKTFACGSQYSQSTYIFKTCFAAEAFYASCEGNDLTIIGASGRKVYHIDGSFDDSELGKPNP